MVAMIDRALLYKEKYVEHKNLFPLKTNPYDKFKNAEQYLGWRELCIWFTGLFEIMNSTKNRLGLNEYSHNLNFLKEFLEWFEIWKCECIERQVKILPANSTSYQKMTGFFTSEASDDCTTMIKAIIQMTEYYCCTDTTNTPLFFLPRRISQDLVENGFSKIRLAIGHGRLDHRTTAAACLKVNLVKEINTKNRNAKKRNASGCQIEINVPENKMQDIPCTDYAMVLIDEAKERKKNYFKKVNPYLWTETDGQKHLKSL